MKKITAAQTEASAARRARFKTLWKQVAAMPPEERVRIANKLGLVTCEGRALSMGNTMLVALQSPSASVVGGFKQWLRHGRAVRKGEHGAMIWVPVGHKSVAEPNPEQEEEVEGDGESDTRFVTGYVFDISQTEEISIQARA